MKPSLGLAVNKLGHDYIIVWFPITQNTHASLTKTRSRTCRNPSFPPLKTIHIFLCNYLINVHIQPEDGQHQWPKHVVVTM